MDAHHHLEAITVAVLSIVLVTGYVCIAPIFSKSVMADKVEKGTRGPDEVAAVRPAARTEATGGQPAARKEATGEDGPRDKPADVPERVIEPSAAVPATNSAGVQVVVNHGPALGVPSNDADFHRERGIAAYRSGDFHRAIADLDQAIQLNPNDAMAHNIRGNAWDGMISLVNCCEGIEAPDPSWERPGEPSKVRRSATTSRPTWLSWGL